MIQTFNVATIGSIAGRQSRRTAIPAVIVAGAITAIAASAWLASKPAPSLVTIMPANSDRHSVWLAPVEVEGKIGARHRAMESDSETGPMGLIMPAALVMPMSTGWPEQNFSESARLAQASPRAATRAIVAEATSGARKPAASGERIMPLPRPLDIAAAASSAPTQAPLATIAAQEAPAQPTLLGRVVAEPVAQAGNIVSSAAGMVGAAGSWTVNQATSLLPRW